MKTQMNHLIAKENRTHSSMLIPYSIYDCDIPRAYANVPVHWHEEFELNYIKEGEGQIYQNGESIPVKAGDLVIIMPNTLHAAYAVRDSVLKYDAFVFSPSLLGSKDRDRTATGCIAPILNGRIKITGHIPAIAHEHPQIHACVVEIMDCARKDSEISDLLLKSTLLKLFYYIERDDSLTSRSDTGSPISDPIRPAITYMEEHSSEKITIEQLAGLCNISKSYFMACFKQTAGTGAIEHLAQLRIMNACKALAGTNTPISLIACSCGYDNLSNFNRQFRKIAGCTPGEYRAKSHI